MMGTLVVKKLNKHAAFSTLSTHDLLLPPDIKGFSALLWQGNTNLTEKTTSTFTY